MKTEQKKLYESIMKDVAKIVKRSINESADFLLDGSEIYLVRSEYNGRVYLSTEEPADESEIEYVASSLSDMSKYLYDNEITMFDYNGFDEQYYILYEGYNDMYIFQTKEGLQYIFEDDDLSGYITVYSSNNLDDCIDYYQKNCAK